MVSERRFHHGDLRAALVRDAMAELEESGIEGVSLRRVAKRAGVSHAATYRHFSGKAALIQEIVRTSQKELYDAFRASEFLARPEDRLRRACEVYLEYAGRQPRLYQLRYVDEVYWQRLGAERPILRPSGYDVFVRIIASLMEPDVRNRSKAVAVTCWAALHGYVQLQMSGAFGVGTEGVAMRAQLVEVLVGIPNSLRR